MRFITSSCFTARLQWMSSDKQNEIKAQKTNPRAIETSKPFASTMSPPLGLASAAASDGESEGRRNGIAAQRGRG